MLLYIFVCFKKFEFMQLKHIIAISISTLIVGCSSLKQESFVGVWKLTNIEDPALTSKGQKIDSTYSDYIKEITDNYIASSFVNFYNNKQFTYRFGSVFLNGTWKYNVDSSDLILNSKENILVLNVDEFDGKSKLNLYLKPDNKLINKVKKDSIDKVVGEGFSAYFSNASYLNEFEKDTFIYKDKSQDIYSLENNYWRVKPNNKESQKQIKERLKASIYFTIIYLNNNNLRNDETINLSGINSPIKLGGNGISLYSEDELPHEWVDVFYDKSQAIQAYQMLVMTFLQKININNQEKWIDLDVDLLHQIYSKL